jgi:hypothetical protein
VGEKKNIWVSIDETTNVSERKITNVVIGVFKNDQTQTEK